MMILFYILIGFLFIHSFRLGLSLAYDHPNNKIK